jgi:hypothetical protein
MNFWILSSLVFELIEKDLRIFVHSDEAVGKGELYIPKQVQQWIGSSRIKVRLTGAGSDWFGVTYANDKEKALQRLAEKSMRNIYPTPLWKKSRRS